MQAARAGTRDVSAIPILRRLLCSLCLAAALAMPAAAQTQTQNAEAEIRARLEQWKQDFNDGKKDKVCDLFSRQAISDFRGQPSRNYDEICALLQRSIDDPAKTYRYELDIREVLVKDALAIVRLTWMLHISPHDITTVEPGMDIFLKEPDGKWRIIRYMAYEQP